MEEVMEKESKVIQFTTSWEQPTDNSVVREQALAALHGMDFPTTRVEDWKYTRVSKYIKRNYKQNKEGIDSIENYTIDGLNAHQLVFVNGYFDKSKSTVLEDDALTIQSIDALDESFYTQLIEDTEENVFSLMNKAYSTGGVFIQVKKNKKAQHPVHLIHVLKGEGVVANTRHFIQTEEGAEVEVEATFHSMNAVKSFNNVVLEGYVAENSKMTINRIQDEEEEVFNITSELFIQEASSNLNSCTITTGGALVRNGLDVLVEGENCHTELNGAYLTANKQVVDNHTSIEQLAANCTSHQLYKGVLDGKSTGTFNGKVIVRPNSQKIDAYQSNKNILLSEDATVNSKPELEIYADDVVCSHGSTIGDLDEQALFYMRTRGIPEDVARNLLVAAFISDVVDKIENEAIRNYINE